MHIRLLFRHLFLTWIICVTAMVGAVAAEPQPSSVAFLKTHCVKCHNSTTAKADFRLDDILPLSEGNDDLGRWEKVLEMVSIGQMPPEDQSPEDQSPEDPPQLAKDVKKQFLATLEADLAKLKPEANQLEKEFPEFANRVSHEDLFSGEYKGPAFTRPRVWRISPRIYEQFVEDMDVSSFETPLPTVQGGGFDDYALLYADEATLGTLLLNGQRVAMALIHGRLITPAGAARHDPKNRPYRTGSRHRIYTEFIALEGEPTEQQLEDVVTYSFDLLLQRQPTEAQLTRYATEGLQKNLESGSKEAALRGFLVTVLLSPEFLFRMELGLGEKLPDGRRMLSPHELAFALSFALHDHPMPWLLDWAKTGKLETEEDVQKAVRKLLEDDKLYRGHIPAARRGKPLWEVGKLRVEDAAKPRMLRFFREFFDYAKAEDLFKDDIRHAKAHDPKLVVDDADWFVLNILYDDKHVFERLLTSDEFPFVRTNANRPPRALVYNLDDKEIPEDGNLDLPEGQRAGILTHPAWLVAHSGNFETDPVRRGKWIQLHLLGGVVPDIPIGVEAQLPEEPHHTIRERFRVVREEACWRCHKRMNPLGEPFEQFDDFGRYRDKHFVTPEGKVLASDLELNRNNRNLKAEPKIPVDTTGELRGTGDPELDGEVKDAIDLVNRLAKSDRVRQVIIRHMFRYWMGRNETLHDSPTLMAMDKAYVESEGSFEETLYTLLTSDSFLYRK